MLWAVSAAVCAAAAADASVLLLVEVGEEGADVVHVERGGAALLGRHKLLYPASSDGGVDVHWWGRHHYTHQDPRDLHAHGWQGEGEEWSTGVERRESGAIDVAVPEGVGEIEIRTRGRVFQVGVPSPASWPHRVGQRRGQPLGDGIIQISESISPDGARTMLPRAGPTETQQNVVFLAGGYLADQQELFQRHLDYVVKIFSDSCSDCPNAKANLVPSVPYRRYFSTFNVFAVFQPSREEGASVPLSELSVDNNLGCSYGTTVARALFCEASLQLALAHTAPCGAISKTNVVVVTLVNSKDYGGAAVYQKTKRLGCFATGYYDLSVPKQRGMFASLFFHEVGHCYADLMDEYNMRISTKRTLRFNNCAHTDEAVPWQDWIDCCGTSDKVKAQHLDETFFAVSENPVPVCGYSNYFKPSDTCFMEKLTSGGVVPRLCPVCREQTVVSMYQTGMDLSYPKCPLPDEVLLVGDGPDDGAYVFINHKIVALHGADGGTVNVTWQCRPSSNSSTPPPWIAAPWETPGNKPVSEFDPANPSYVYVTAADVKKCSGAGDAAATVSVILEDQTNWVLEATKKRLSLDRQMIQRHSWTVRYEAFNGTDAPPPTPPGGQGPVLSRCVGPGGSLPEAVQADAIKSAATNGSKFAYWSSCKTGSSCFMNYSSRSYDVAYASNAGLAAEMLEKQFMGTGGILALLGVLAYLALWFFLAKRFSFSMVDCVYGTSVDDVVTWLRRIVMGGGMFFGGVATVGVIVSIALYGTVGPFVKLLLLSAIVLQLFLLIMGFVGATAAYFRQRHMLRLNAVGMVLPAILMCFVAYVVSDVGRKINAKRGTCPSSPTGPNASESSFNDSLPEGTECELEEQSVSLCGFSGIGCELREVWKRAVTDYPERVCAFQVEFKCSGYTKSCGRDQGSEWCPPGCDAANIEYQDACKVKLQGDLETQLKTLTPIVAVLAAGMWIALVLNVVLAKYLRQQRLEWKEQRKAALGYDDEADEEDVLKRAKEWFRKVFGSDEAKQQAQSESMIRKQQQQGTAMKLLGALSPHEQDRMRVAFKRADKDGNGTLDRRELKHFLTGVLGRRCRTGEVDEIFDLLDINGDGAISFEEFISKDWMECSRNSRSIMDKSVGPEELQERQMSGSARSRTSSVKKQPRTPPPDVSGLDGSLSTTSGLRVEFVDAGTGDRLVCHSAPRRMIGARFKVLTGPTRGEMPVFDRAVLEAPTADPQREDTSPTPAGGLTLFGSFQAQSETAALMKDLSVRRHHMSGEGRASNWTLVCHQPGGARRRAVDLPGPPELHRIVKDLRALFSECVVNFDWSALHAFGSRPAAAAAAVVAAVAAAPHWDKPAWALAPNSEWHSSIGDTIRVSASGDRLEWQTGGRAAEIAKTEGGQCSAAGRSVVSATPTRIVWDSSEQWELLVPAGGGSAPPSPVGRLPRNFSAGSTASGGRQRAPTAPPSRRRNQPATPGPNPLSPSALPTPSSFLPRTPSGGEQADYRPGGAQLEVVVTPSAAPRVAARRGSAGQRPQRSPAARPRGRSTAEGGAPRRGRTHSATPGRMPRARSGDSPAVSPAGSPTGSPTGSPAARRAAPRPRAVSAMQGSPVRSPAALSATPPPSRPQQGI